ncbi:MAG: hypothetical protein KA054_00055 [Candidatus Moranbacteria bacterium]|nr:hypothetical protein [Candidatus Moranbacteria bacterium]
MKVVKVSWESSPSGSGGEVVFSSNIGMLSKSNMGTGSYYQMVSTGPHIARVVRESPSGGDSVFTVTMLTAAKIGRVRYLAPNDTFTFGETETEVEVVALNISFLFQIVDVG